MSNRNWTTENIPDQKDRVAIVTGSSSGIGYEAARVLAGSNSTVIIAVRNLEKGKTAAEKIAKEFEDASLHILELDLANLESVRKFADDFKEEYSRLDLLINNAGVMMPPYSKTADGFELQFGTNHLGHFALTAQLLDVLNQTENSRIVNVASGAHKFADFDLNDLNWEKRSYSRMKSYGASKIANLYFTYELQRRLSAAGSATIATAAHPGWTATELQRHNGLFELLNSFFAQDISMGALPTLRAAIDEEAKGGDYFGPDGFMEMRGYPVKVDSNTESKDEAIAKKLWEISEEMTGVQFEIGEKSKTANPNS
ncbi:MAG: SDR family NAD(P)-dependent oxidoreductase [Pyrinomonadaceae bacterium]|nr:SDR family NAD(P)-dependent oxidoreductase [Pyrinomonadaceae bacterium]